MEFIRSFFNGIYNFFGWNTKSGRIIFLGLDDAGKSTLLRVLKDGRLSQMNPTLHAHVEKLTVGNIHIVAIDIGGHKVVRKTWRHYFAQLDAIVYLVDVSDPVRFKESREELENILNSDEIKGIPIAIIGNKIDKLHAVSEEELR